MRAKFLILVLAVPLMLFMLGFSPVQATSVDYGFYNFENSTGSVNVSSASGQFSMLVTNEEAYGFTPDSGEVAFWFTNVGNVQSTIFGVYFDDGALFGINELQEGSNVDFNYGAGGSTLPGGNNLDPPFVTTADFYALKDTAQTNGINNVVSPITPLGAGEYLGIIFELQEGKNINDVIAALSLPSEEGAEWLRVGLHVGDFADGTSGSYVNNPVPIPAAAWIFGSGLLGLVGIRRKFRT